jgi:hypothetical protein
MTLAPLRDLKPRIDVKGGNSRSLETPPGGIPFRDYVEMRFKALEKATESDRIELERRLTDLNKLREDVVKDRMAFITKDTYSGTETARALWRETYETELKAISDRLLIIETRSVIWTGGLGIFFTGLQATIGAVIYWLLHK